MPFWEDNELRRFYQAYHKHGNNWVKVVKALNHSKHEEDCESLWRMQKTLLGLQNNKIMEDAFVASVADAQDNVLRSGTPKHGAAEGHKASDSNHSGSTSSLQATAKRRRTPRARKSLEPVAEPSRGGRGSPAHPQGFNQSTPTHGRKAPGTPTWPNGRPSILNGSPAPSKPTPGVDPPSSGHKRKRHRKLFEDDGSPRRFAASGGMSPERPGSHNSTLQNGQKHNNTTAWRRPPAGGPPEQPHEDVGAADALLSLKAMPRTGCPPPPTAPSSAHNTAAEQEPTEKLHRSASLSRQEEEGESPEMKATGGVPPRNPPRQAIRREPSRPSFRASSGDDYHDVGSTPPTASPSTSYPGHPQVERWESRSGQATSAMKRMRATMGSSIEPVQANSTPGPSSDNALLTITVPAAHEHTRDVSSLAAEPSTASEGPAPSSQLSGGPAPLPHDAMMSNRNPYLPPHSMLPQQYPHDPIHPHSMSGSTMQHHAHAYDPQRRVMTPLSVRQHAAATARWPQPPQPPTATKLSARRSQRKSLPERMPPMAPSLAKLLSKTSLQAPNPFPGYGASGSMGSAFVPHGHLQKFPVGETGDRVGPAEIVLRHSLSLRLRRWCMCEFLYSAIDRPYFMRNEWLEFLRYIGLGGATKLTRTEWSVMRSGSFGKPRRLSQAFLKSERLRLEAYRETVRMLYENSAGAELPINMPKPLYVGQHVTARHPMTRQIHDGVILTVANKGNKYRVQFNRTELMTEMVRDVDVMPMDPNENLPPAMLPLTTTVNGRLGNGAVGPRRQRSVIVPSVGPAAGRAQQDARVAQAAPHMAEQPASEADAALTLEVQMLLNMKEALLSQLRSMNSQAASSRDVGRDQEFQKDYSTVMVQLGQVNDQLKGSLEKLLGQSPHLLGMAKPIDGAAGNTAGQAPPMAPEPSPEPPLQPLQPTSPRPPRHSSPDMIQPPTQHSVASDTANLHAHMPQMPGQSGPPAPAPFHEPAPTPAVPATHISAKAIVDNAMREARELVIQHSLRNRESVSPPKPNDRPEAPRSQSAGAGTNTDTTNSGPANNPHAQDHNLSSHGLGSIPEHSSGRRLSDNPADIPQLHAQQEQTHTSVQGGTEIHTFAGQPRAGVGEPRASAGQNNAMGNNRQMLVEDVITGCVGMLFTVQQCTRNNVPEATLEGALDMVLQTLAPRMPGNMAVFHDIAAAVGTLKVQLANSS